MLNDWRKGEDGVYRAEYGAPLTQLFVDGSRAQRARAPYQGYFRIEGKSSTDEHFLLHYKGNDIKPEWAGTGAEVVVLLAWAEMRRPILKVDPQQHIATLAGPSRFGTREETARYWVENIPDGGLKDGEWRQDQDHHLLHYKPTTNDASGKLEFIVPKLAQLVDIGDSMQNGSVVHDIELRRITFRYSSWSLPEDGFGDSQAATLADSAIQISDAVRIHIEGCSFNAMAGYAIHLRSGTHDDRVDHSNFYDLGGGAIRIGEQSILKDAARVYGNTFDDNEVHEIGKVYPSAVAVWIGQSSGNYIAHNHLYDLPYTAISVGWTWGYGSSAAGANRIEFNSIHNVGTVLSDLGAIYTLGGQAGTVIRNNVIHDVSCFTYGGWGIYLDEGSSNILVEDNIVYRTQSAGFHQHYGRENLVRNNVFAFGRDYQIMRTRSEPTVSFIFERNIVLFDSGKLLGYKWGTGHVLDWNLYWDVRGGQPQFGADSWEDWRRKGYDRHSLIADPQFVNPFSFDFRLRTSSPAPSLGIHSINIDGIGPGAWTVPEAASKARMK